MHKFSQVFFFIVCVFFVQSKALAIEVTDLYMAHVPVSSKAEKEKKLALKNAMKAVLIKVSGQPDVLSNKVVTASIRRYSHYYTQFRYQKINDTSVLTVSFDEEKINSILSQAELPIWGSLRPQILLWVVDENGLTRQVIPQSSEGSIPEDIAAFSETRGLPFVLPEMATEETEASSLTISDLWGRFSEPTLLASKEYGAESVVIIRISNSSLVSSEDPSCEQPCDINDYALDWRFISNRTRLNETSTYKGSVPKALLNQALEDITDNVYKRYALTSHENHEFQIDVANIHSLSDYINVKAFLIELSSVKAVTLVNVKENNRRFNLQLMGSPEAFLATLTLNKSLEQYIDPLADIDVLSPPVFFWKQP